MAARYAWTEFATRPELAAALAGKVAGLLSQAVAERGTALLAVSGGTTPALFFDALSREPVAWDKVVVTLVDERFVPASSPRSNAGLVAANLLKNAAAAARFVPLYHDAVSAEAAATADDAAMKALPWPLDAAILGMGADGHTASFFPDAENLGALLDPASNRIVLPSHAPSAGEARFTLTAARIVEAKFLALHIEGQEKRAAFDEAMAGNDKKPVRAVFDAAPHAPEVFWAP